MNVTVSLEALKNRLQALIAGLPNVDWLAPGTFTNLLDKNRLAFFDCIFL
ncbi:MAG: hypothetical protein R6U04_04615 [Bacteroidales bacterium]